MSLSWIRTVTKFTVNQFLVQALATIAGLMIVRALSKPDYALYTLTISAIATFSTAFDCGTSEATFATGGRVWNDRTGLGNVLASATSVRRLVARFTTIPVAIFQYWLLLHNGASLGEGAILVVAAWVCADWQLSTELLRVILRLRSRLTDILYIDTMSALLRVALTFILFLVSKVNFAVIIILIGTAIGYLISRYKTVSLVELNAPVDASVRIEILTSVRRRWPYDLFSIYYGQVTLLLLSLLGESMSVADFGALTRIAIVYTILTLNVRTIALPRYARVRNPDELRRLYFLIMGISFAIILLLTTLIGTCSTPILWLLGSKYEMLSYELLLVAASAGTAFLSSVAWDLNTARGWIIPYWVIIPIELITLVVLLLSIGAHTIQQLLWVATSSNLVITFIYFLAALFYSKFFRHV